MTHDIITQCNTSQFEFKLLIINNVQYHCSLGMYNSLENSRLLPNLLLYKCSIVLLRVCTTRCSLFKQLNAGDMNKLYYGKIM